MQIIQLLLEPAILLAALGIASRILVDYIKIKDKISAIQERVDSLSTRQNYLYEQMGILKDSLRQTDINLNNHIGTEGHIGTVHDLKEVEEKLERLKIFAFQMNDRIPNPVDPSKLTFS